jgi:hypothetical protein
MFAPSNARAARFGAWVRKYGGVLALAVLPVAAGMGCSEAPTEAPVAGASGGGAGPGPSVPINPLGRARCSAPPDTTGSPRTIEAAVALLNALPKPTSVACFVESLDRPLAVFATNSRFSAQPAFSDQSPRLFIKLGELWISIVIDGESSYLVEFGELTADAEPRSLKGELQLPLEAPIAPSAPFERVLYGGGTVCGLCHAHEQQAPKTAFTSAFTSLALRPRPETRVALDGLRLADRSCDWRLEPHRCELLSSVFQGGVVTEVSFPDSMATLF